MIENLSTSEVLGAWEPSSLESYLRFRGWDEFERVEGEVALWDNYDETGRRFRIWLPLDRSLADFLPSMRRVIKSLAAFEERPQSQMLEDLSILATGDIVRVRFQDGLRLTDDTVPIDEGLQLVQRSRNMASAAACAAVEPRAVFPTRRFGRAIKYLEQVQLGQTERGSFIVKLISPLPPEQPRQLALLDYAKRVPFERKVICTLMGSLKALKEAAIENQESRHFFFEPFKESVPEGVSANLCEAIVGIDSGGQYRPLEISVSWSYMLDPTPGVVDKVLFPTELMPYIEEAAGVFREQTWEEVELRGYVTTLHREQAHGRGSITVVSMIEGRQRKVRIEIDEDDYNTAIQAHGRGLEISCKGRLERKGNRFMLTDVAEDFRIVRP